jgi:hypothetical protein
LQKDLNDLAAAAAFALSGLRLELDRLKEIPTIPENPDPRIYLGIGDPNIPGALPYASWRLSEAADQLQPDGPVATSLGHQWIVFLYSVWEHVYRPRLAVVHNRNAEEERYPVLGDLRYLRNDVVHHRGVATRENTGRCQILLWFQPGEAINLKLENIDQFMRIFPWGDIKDGK